MVSLCCLNSTVFYFSAVNGIYQNTVYGLAAKLPFKYTGAVVLGSVRELDFVSSAITEDLFCFVDW